LGEKKIMEKKFIPGLNEKLKRNEKDLSKTLDELEDIISELNLEKMTKVQLVILQSYLDWVEDESNFDYELEKIRKFLKQ